MLRRAGARRVARGPATGPTGGAGRLVDQDEAGWRAAHPHLPDEPEPTRLSHVGAFIAFTFLVHAILCSVMTGLSLFGVAQILNHPAFLTTTAMTPRKFSLHQCADT